MAGVNLPVNIDTTYADSGTDASVKVHQGHHDTIHGVVNRLSCAFAPEDIGLLQCNFDPVSGVGTSSVLTTAGTMYVQRLRCEYPITVTSVIAQVKTAGVTLTAGQCFAALYDSAGNLLRQSVDQATAWQSQGVVTMALSSPVAVNPPYFRTALWANGTTLPAFMRGNASEIGIHGINAVADSRWGSANTGTTTTAPATLGTITQLYIPYWVGVA